MTNRFKFQTCLIIILGFISFVSCSVDDDDINMSKYTVQTRASILLSEPIEYTKSYSSTFNTTFEFTNGTETATIPCTINYTILTNNQYSNFKIDATPNVNFDDFGQRTERKKLLSNAVIMKSTFTATQFDTTGSGLDQNSISVKIDTIPFTDFSNNSKNHETE